MSTPGPSTPSAPKGPTAPKGPSAPKGSPAPTRRPPADRPPTAAEVVASQNPARNTDDPTRPDWAPRGAAGRLADAYEPAAAEVFAFDGEGIADPSDGASRGAAGRLADFPEVASAQHAGIGGAPTGDQPDGAPGTTPVSSLGTGAPGGGLSSRLHNGPLDRLANQRDVDGNRTTAAELARSLDNRGTAQRIADAHAEGGGRAAAVEGVKEAAARGIEAGTGGLIPKQATRFVTTLMQKSKTARVVVSSSHFLPFILPLISVFVLLVIITSVLGMRGRLDGGIPETDWARTTGTEGHLAVIQAAALEHEIPWTVLASISLLATEHGKFSPYPDDLVDRDPGREGIRRPNSGTVGAPAPTGAPTPGPVTVVGDSLCEPGAAADALITALRGAGWTPTLDCQRGRALTGGGEAVATRAITEGTPVIVALGTNDAVGANTAAFRAALDRTLSASATTPVTWVNVGTAQPGAAAINNELAAAVARHPNLTIADFAADTAANPALITSDGIHLNAEGYTVRANRIVATLTGGGFAGPAAGGITYPENPEDLEVSTFPRVEPPIGDEGKPGVGPYLLAPRVLDDVDAQMVGEGGRSATQFLARQIRRTADQVEAEGWSSQGTPEEIDRFWTEVVRRLPIADPRAAQGCQVPPVSADRAGDPDGFRSQVAIAITEVWRCEIDNAPAFHTLTARTTEAGAVEAPGIVIDEALTVAWAFSGWGTRACDPNATYAGVFPLSAEVFETYGEGDRCSVGDNIVAAAKAFIAGESVKPGERDGDGALGDRTDGRGRYAPMVGGWWAMPWALGSSENLERFLRDGRASATVLDSTCHAAIVAWVERAGTDPSLPADPAGALESLRSSPTFTGACPQGTFDADAVSAAIAAAAAAEAEYLRSVPELVEGGASDPADSGVEFDYGDTPAPTEDPRVVGRAELDERAARLDAVVAELGREGATPYTPGIDAAVARLSATGKAPVGRPAVPQPTTPSSDEHASTVVALAVALGGTFEGDMRGHNSEADPESIIRSFWGTGALGGAGGQLGADVPFADVFNAAGAQFGIDPRLLAAVARAESGFDQKNISCENRSSAGALGIMQFMPGTAAGFGIDPCDPAQAIPAAAQYLSGLYAKFGDWEVALAGYNWGPNRSQIRNRAAWPAETARYVPKVMGYWEEYKQRYPDGAIAVGMTLGPGPVSPEMCPRTAPPGTVRKGAEAIGVFELCRRSVLAAPTPAAAKAIVAAMSHLGLSYSQARRLDADKCDCTSFVSRAYRMAGIDTFNFGGRSGNYAPWTGSFLAGQHSSWATPISTAEMRPGDIVITPGHALMPLADGMIVHCTGPTSEVRNFYSRDRIVQVFRVNPAAAPPPSPPAHF